jgi:hypothetical protein
MNNIALFIKKNFNNYSIKYEKVYLLKILSLIDYKY